MSEGFGWQFVDMLIILFSAMRMALYMICKSAAFTLAAIQAGFAAIHLNNGFSVTFGA
jgi:hypothetical protein